MRNLDYIDQEILNSIFNTGDILDLQLSQKLYCSRMFLLDRLSSLIRKGFVIEWQNSYALSKTGRKVREPILTSIPDKKQNQSPTFIWDSLYIPSPEWDAE